MKFLVVDDSVTMRRIAVKSLQRLGFADIIEASNGQDALEKFDASIGFVITEWNMPRMTGTELASALRGRGVKIPILMVTARSERDDILQAVRSGVSNYIVKPFTPQVLKEKIDALTTSAPASAAGGP